MIYNIIGGFVKKGKLSSGLNTIDVSNVGTGIYIVRMANGKCVSSQKNIIK